MNKDSACNKFYEENQFYGEKESQCESFRKEKIKHVSSFTKKNQHANKLHDLTKIQACRQNSMKKISFTKIGITICKKFPEEKNSTSYQVSQKKYQFHEEQAPRTKIHACNNILWGKSSFTMKENQYVTSFRKRKTQMSITFPEHENQHATSSTNN